MVLNQNFDLRAPGLLPWYGLATLLGVAPTRRNSQTTLCHFDPSPVKKNVQKRPKMAKNALKWPQATSGVTMVWFGKIFLGLKP